MSKDTDAAARKFCENAHCPTYDCGEYGQTKEHTEQLLKELKPILARVEREAYERAAKLVCEFCHSGSTTLKVDHQGNWFHSYQDPLWLDRQCYANGIHRALAAGEEKK